MAKFTPMFTSAKRIPTQFSTNNPGGRDRESVPVFITEISFNDTTRTIEAMCSDKRKRQCRIDRFMNDQLLRDLVDSLQNAYDNELEVVFVAAGGNDPNVWFYNIVIIEE